MPLIIIAAGVALLLILMIGFKVNGFIALVLVAAVVGFAEGMDAQAVLHSIQNGIGSTLRPCGSRLHRAARRRDRHAR
ncbi:hypothetical protein K5Y84_004742, partial [Escherichia coli]|nr:hypothetical protein [Escherichia coli]